MIAMNRAARRKAEVVLRRAPPRSYECAAPKTDGTTCGMRCKSEKLGKHVIVTHALPHCEGYTAMVLPTWMRRGDVP